MAQENPEKWIQIDLSKFRLDYIERQWSVLSYHIGIGKEDTPTPTGVYFVSIV